jgi:outer membrane lipoprotein LolB
LSGCATFSGHTIGPGESGNARQALYALKAWRADGRLAVQTAGDAWQANLYWDHDEYQDRLRVSGPFSQGAVSIILQKDLIYINEGNGVSVMSRDPDRDLRERLGFAVPWASLRFWLLGVPDPAAHAQTSLTQKNGATSFSQSGWSVTVDRYAGAGSRFVPQKMRIEGEKAKLKIVIDSWEIGG